MMTVRDFVMGAIKPIEVRVLIGSREYYIVDGEGDRADKRLLDMMGDYVVEDFKSNEPDKYAVFVLERPVRASELTGTTP